MRPKKWYDLAGKVFGEKKHKILIFDETSPIDSEGEKKSIGTTFTEIQ